MGKPSSLPLRSQSALSMPASAVMLPAPSPCVTICWRSSRCQMPSLSSGSAPAMSEPSPSWITAAMAVGFWP